MFSMAPLSLNFKSDISNNATIGDVTGSTKLLVPGRATAGTNIPQGAVTSPIEPDLLRGHSDIVQIMVGTGTNKTIDLDNSSKQIWCKNIHWVRALRLSDDCHSYNIQLKISKKENPTKLILQAVKPISAGQELQLWFSEEILGLLQIVFLTPANIQGQKKYVCTRCSTLYESPNPLKLHIMLGCGRQTISDLWNRLAMLLKENAASNSGSCTEFTFKLTPKIFEVQQKSAIDLSAFPLEIKRPTSQPSISYEDRASPLSIDTAKILYRPYTEPPSTRNSAFKPFQKLEVDKETQAQSPFILQNLPNTQLSWPNMAFNQNFFSQNYVHNNGAAFNDEAQIETLMSSLGKSKEGHVCLYCGKCYSRKYGLKIHIRTHTGYKPLKCKFCLRPFGDPSNLNKHVRLHAEGETPYKCELCGKILVRRRDLERHLKSRHMGDILPGRSIVEEHNNGSDVTDEDNEGNELNVNM